MKADPDHFLWWCDLLCGDSKHAVVCEMDSQYRIVIPQKLREYAGIDREVVMIGHTDTVAIWDKAAWDKINSPEEIDLKEIAEIGELFNI